MRHHCVSSLWHVCGVQCMCHDEAIFNVSFVFSSFFWYMMIKKDFIIILSQQEVQKRKQ